MLTADDFMSALGAGDFQKAEQCLNEMSAEDLKRVGEAFCGSEHSSARAIGKDLLEHARLRDLGEQGVRIRVPISLSALRR